MADPSHIFRWDLDKTYLRTDFDTLRGLVRAAFEKASEKRAVPGAPAILRALRAAGGRAHRICIISGSPRQMHDVLAAKLALDGVEYDEFVLKPNLRNLVRGRFRAIRAQLPYKLPALLVSRSGVPGAAPETLFGDDAESDAIIYSLYADLLAGAVDAAELTAALQAAQAYDDEVQRTLALAEAVPKLDVVRRILILLDRRSPLARFDRLGPRLVPIFNYFQAALVLYGDGQLGPADVLGVANEMLASGDHSLSTLANSLQDLLRRRRLERATAIRLAGECQGLLEARPPALAGLPPMEEIAWAFTSRVRALGETIEGGDGEPAAVQAPIDYVALIREEQAAKK